MPMPKRASVDDYFARLNDVQRPHLEALRKLSVVADPKAREELKWNLPVYVRGENTNLWMLQNFKNHCSLRFATDFSLPSGERSRPQASKLVRASSSCPTDDRCRRNS